MLSASASRDDLWKNILTDLRSTQALKKWGEPLACNWLPGDASNRYYGRIDMRGARGMSTAILMVMNAPEAFKSEEATGSSAKPKELPFLSVGRKFFESGVRVPEIFYVSPSSDYMVLEDLGDFLLFQKRQQEPAMSWYEKAIDQLVKIQKISDLNKDQSFTRDLLKWETEHFVEYALLKREKQFSEGALQELRLFLDRIVDVMAESSYCLVHRDFHSKNLMVLERESLIGVIDFQDALWGPPVYDLASLLRDSYVALTDDEENHLLAYFEKVSGRPLDRQLFAYTSLQRNLKAIGRFYYIQMVKGRDTHIPFVKPSLLRVFKTLRQNHELRILSLLEGLLSHESR